MTTSSVLRLAELPDVLTVRQVADFLGVADNTVYESVRRRELPSVRVGRRVLVGRAALVRFLEGADEEGRAFGALGGNGDR